MCARSSAKYQPRFRNFNENRTERTAFTKKTNNRYKILAPFYTSSRGKHKQR